MTETNDQSLEDGMISTVLRNPEFAGRRVIIRCHGDIPCVRRLLGIEGRVAIVCKVEAYNAISLGAAEGKMEDSIFGFPLEDVYEATPELEKSKRPWEQATSLATTLGPERLEVFIRKARARRNHRESY
jgi:hypothetical protein